ncbi:protein-tyrosine-phosphatase [Philodulcilactobacillus myokoensis]|uniref:Protein-tyrosine-phosphatase n=1 Tax=Philodulcilactobacillus myokoensis TaxID=2929573 RepID=A0A9W6ETD4_9LACO|nr:tyrosine-protein phosphatase [Philodulcilactobacillus myokoensis]GLB47302.1 protein-tyrosine-phosphatase [Philodulcilactobacillus myokoensis]
MVKRFLPIKHGDNFRDIGGYRTNTNQIVKWHKIVRSGHIADLSLDDQRFLLNYQITRVIDFRSNQERRMAPDRLSNDVQYEKFPIFDNHFIVSHQKEMTDPKFNYRNMLNMYQFFILSSQAQKSFQNFFQSLMNNPGNHAILFHCSQGKDRTGMAASMLLLVLGVDIQTVKNDYLLSKKPMIPYIHRKLTQIKPEFINDNFKRNLYDLYIVHKAYFDTAVNTIRCQYGTFDHFTHQFLGLSQNDIQVLKHIYLTNTY